MAKKNRNIVSFDECVSAFPDVQLPPRFQEIWTEAIEKLRKTPPNFTHRILLTKSLGREALYHISFTGSAGNTIHGTLSVPRGLKHRPTVIVFPDYLDSAPGSRPFTAAGLGHFCFDNPASPLYRETRSENYEITGPSLENIETSHLFHYHLDVLRTVELISSLKTVDSDKIGIMAAGLSAGAGIFAAAELRDRVKLLVLERPSTGWMENWLQSSSSYYASEIRRYLELQQPRTKSRVKKNLTFFDPLHWLEDIKVPVLMSACMEDRQNPPINSFAIFNRLNTEKYMDLYMEDRMDPDGIKKRKKALDFFSSRLPERESQENIFD